MLCSWPFALFLTVNKWTRQKPVRKFKQWLLFYLGNVIFLQWFFFIVLAVLVLHKVSHFCSISLSLSKHSSFLERHFTVYPLHDEQVCYTPSCDPWVGATGSCFGSTNLMSHIWKETTAACLTLCSAALVWFPVFPLSLLLVHSVYMYVCRCNVSRSAHLEKTTHTEDQ